jgi:hypothetical protein
MKGNLAAMSQVQIADVLARYHRVFDDTDIRRVQRYLRSRRMCSDYDRLDHHTRSLVATITRVVPDTGDNFNDGEN